ncbi:MAG: chorismate synthase [Eubacteriales bacterium]
MRDTYGNALNISLFGESHGKAIGVVIDGIASGITFSPDFMAKQMDKRRASGAISTPRVEPDLVHILSGMVDHVSTGSAISLMIQNTNTKSKDYSETQYLLRPGHADFTAFEKYHGFQDIRGGGHFSGRLTAPIVAAGSLFTQILAQQGVYIATHLLECAGVRDQEFSYLGENLLEEIHHLNDRHFSLLDPLKEGEMKEKILAAASEGDSVGGILETVIYPLPTGLGEPFFTSVESVLSSLLFSMPAVKGIEFGAGFSMASMRGSQANDPFVMSGEKILTETNHNGGINGGITNGMPLILRTVVKPTASIFKEQDTVHYQNKTAETLQIHGRHDPCILHRARVVQDSLCAIGIADLWNMREGLGWQRRAKWNMD